MTALIGVAAILFATFLYATMRLLGYKPSPDDFGSYTGLGVGLIMSGIILYPLLGVVVKLSLGIWLWPFGPANSH